MGGTFSHLYSYSYRSYSYRSLLDEFWKYHAPEPSRTLSIPFSKDDGTRETLGPTRFFDWIPDWQDARDYNLTKFYDHLEFRTLTDEDKKVDLSISAYLDTRKTDVDHHHDGAAREVAYAASIAYSSAEHVMIPIMVDYKLLYKKTINRMLNRDIDSEIASSGPIYPVPIREVLKTLCKHGLANVLSHWTLIFYNLKHSLDAVRLSLIHGHPVVFGFVVSEAIFSVDQEHAQKIDDRKVCGSMVGCIVGFSEKIFKIHVSDPRFFGHHNTGFLYLTEDYLRSDLCDDFYSILGVHESPAFELLESTDPTSASI